MLLLFWEEVGTLVCPAQVPLKDSVYLSPLRCSLFSQLMASSEKYQLAIVL